MGEGGVKVCTAGYQCTLRTMHVCLTVCCWGDELLLFVSQGIMGPPGPQGETGEQGQKVSPVVLLSSSALPSASMLILL